MILIILILLFVFVCIPIGFIAGVIEVIRKEKERKELLSAIKGGKH